MIAEIRMYIRNKIDKFLKRNNFSWNLRPGLHETGCALECHQVMTLYGLVCS